MSDTVDAACLKTPQRERDCVTSTRVLAETLRFEANTILAENRGEISRSLWQDLKELADRLYSVAS